MTDCTQAGRFAILRTLRVGDSVLVISNTIILEDYTQVHFPDCPDGEYVVSFRGEPLRNIGRIARDKDFGPIVMLRDVKELQPPIRFITEK